MMRYSVQPTEYLQKARDICLLLKKYGKKHWLKYKQKLKSQIYHE